MADPSSSLGESNARLRSLSDLLAAPSQLSLTLQHFSAVREELRHAQRVRREIAAAGGTATPSARKEQAEYRATLEKLQGLLSSLHTRMLVERARLDRDRSHLEAASSWRRRHLETL